MPSQKQAALKLPPRYCEWSEGDVRYHIVNDSLDCRVLIVERYVDGGWRYDGSRTQFELLCVGIRAWTREVERLKRDTVRCVVCEGSGRVKRSNLTSGSCHNCDGLGNVQSDGYVSAKAQQALWEALWEAATEAAEGKG